MSVEGRHLIARGSLRLADGAILAFVLVAFFSNALGQIFMALASLAWLTSLACGAEYRRVRWPLAGLMLAFAVVSLISAALSAHPAESAWALRSLPMGPVFFFVCVNRLRRQSRRWVVAFVLAGGLAALHGLTQTVRFGVEYRIQGMLSHYMTYSGLLLLVLLLGLPALLVRRHGKWRWPLGLSLALALVALLLTQTRGAWLGLLAGGVLILALYRPRTLWAVPVLGLLLLLFAPQPIRERAISAVDPNDATAVERTYMWRAGLRVIADHPWAGVGTSNLRGVYPGYRLPDDPRLPWQPFTHLHNNLLQVAAERGLVALAVWLAFWVVWFRRAAAAYAARGDEFEWAVGVGAMACIVGFLVAGLFEYNYGDSEVVNTVHALLALPLALRQGPEE